MNSEWYDQETDGTVRPTGTPTIDAVGLLNYYEATAGSGANVVTGFLNNGLYWWLLTPYNSTQIQYIDDVGNTSYRISTSGYGIRPSLNLKSSVIIVNGNGTADDPYRLEGDNDSNLSGTLLNTRYSGEYISFGTGENNLYRIVSHETEGLTKITSAELLKENETYKVISFGNVYYSSTNTIGLFLNGEYLNSGAYLTDEQLNMIEENTTWYLGTVGQGMSYKLAKYTDTEMNNLTSNTTIAKAGLLRLGELMAGKFDRNENNATYWLLSPYSSVGPRTLTSYGYSAYNTSVATNYICPSLNLKSNVIITSGDGTLQNPFTLGIE